MADENKTPDYIPLAAGAGDTAQPLSFRTSMRRSHYLKALNAFQKAIQKIEPDKDGKGGQPGIEIQKNRLASVRGSTREGKAYNYTYHYADIADVLDACMPELAKVGLVIEQTVVAKDHGLNLVTLITHVDSGEWTECDYPLVSDLEKVKHMDIAGYITAVRRYALCPMLGVASEVPTTDDIPEEAYGGPDDHPNAPPRQAPATRSGPPRSRAPERQQRGELDVPYSANADPSAMNREVTGQGAKGEIPGVVDGRITDFDIFMRQHVDPVLKACKSTGEIQEQYDSMVVPLNAQLRPEQKEALVAIAKRYIKSLREE